MSVRLLGLLETIVRQPGSPPVRPNKNMTPREEEVLDFAEAYYRLVYVPEELATERPFETAGQAMLFVQMNLDAAIAQFDAGDGSGNVVVNGVTMAAPTPEEIVQMGNHLYDELALNGGGILGWNRHPEGGTT